MAEGLRDHQEVCDDVIDVPNPIPSLLDKLKCPSTSDLKPILLVEKKDVKEQLPVNPMFLH